MDAWVIVCRAPPPPADVALRDVPGGGEEVLVAARDVAVELGEPAVRSSEAISNW